MCQPGLVACSVEIEAQGLAVWPPGSRQESSPCQMTQKPCAGGGKKKTTQCVLVCVCTPTHCRFPTGAAVNKARRPQPGQGEGGWEQGGPRPTETVLEKSIFTLGIKAGPVCVQEPVCPLVQDVSWIHRLILWKDFIVAQRCL